MAEKACNSTRLPHPTLLVALFTSLAPGAPAVAETATSMRLSVEAPGVYRIAQEQLVAAGWPREAIPTAGLALTHLGRPVSIWVEDHGDGHFGSGDFLEFVGQGRGGESSYFSPYSRQNVYFLKRAPALALRMGHERERRQEGGPAQPLYRARLHLEEDRLLLRLPPRAGAKELWFWHRLTHLDRQPLNIGLDLPKLSSQAKGSARLRAHLRGWSSPRRRSSIPDHQVQVALNGEPLGVAEWNAQDEYVFEVPQLPLERLHRGANVLSFHIQPRHPDGGQDPLIDVVMLNWVEIDYPRDATVSAAGQTRFELENGRGAQTLAVLAPVGSSLRVYGDDGSRIEPHLTTREGPAPKVERRRFTLSGAARSMYVVSGDRYLSPVQIELDRPSALRATTSQADYLMIVHPRLRQPTESLAELHRDRGLTVEVVDIHDIYDEFSHGLVHPKAIRDFIHHAYHSWQRPAPRFVLLVGDASWDARNLETDDRSYADWTYRPGETARFVKNGSTPYAQRAELNHRNLIPTGSYATSQGHAASDNWFVSVAGEDHLPDLAIGRLPVTEPEEVARIVDKSRRYATDPNLGPWRRKVLWITNEQENFQRQSDRLATSSEALGYASTKVYPRAAEADNRHHQEALREAIGSGQLLVHFLGHGGRYIWRTGPPDYRKNHDLFTLEDLDQLAVTDQLPVVLSMTCYSAPFDHPSADSIGEKFLRLDGAGAVAVFGASWRNNPTAAFSAKLVHELSAAGETTLGEGILRAKRQTRNRVLVETYNLLGDPALPLAAPRKTVTLAVTARDNARLRLIGEIDAPGFSGRAIVEWLDEAGDVVATDGKRISGTSFRLSLGEKRWQQRAPRAVRVYAWDEDRGIDGIGYLKLKEPGMAAQTEAATSTGTGASP